MTKMERKKISLTIVITVISFFLLTFIVLSYFININNGDKTESSDNTSTKKLLNSSEISSDKKINHTSSIATTRRLNITNRPSIGIEIPKKQEYVDLISNNQQSELTLINQQIIYATSLDDTVVVEEDIEFTVPDGTTFNFPQGTLIESGDIIYVGSEDVKVIYADGRSVNLTIGTLIEIMDLNAPSGRLNIVDAIDKQRGVGCNTTGNTTMIVMLNLLTTLLNFKLQTAVRRRKR